MVDPDSSGAGHFLTNGAGNVNSAWQGRSQHFQQPQQIPQPQQLQHQHQHQHQQLQLQHHHHHQQQQQQQQYLPRASHLLQQQLNQSGLKHHQFQPSLMTQWQDQSLGPNLHTPPGAGIRY